MSRLGFLIAVALVVGCSDQGTSLEVRLVAEPSEAQVLAAIDTLELILDAPDGFVGADNEGDRIGELEVFNNDGDSKLELRLTRKLSGRTTLPLFRLLPGQNLSRTFRLMVLGKADTRTAAVGGKPSVSFVSNETRELLVPFALLEEHLPPRVTFTQPHDGETLDTTTLGQVNVWFSKQIDTKDLESVLALSYGDDRIRVPGKWEPKTVSASDVEANVELATTRSLASYRVDCKLNPGTYWITASTKIVDLSGVALDQNPATPEPDAFEGSFVINTPQSLSGPCEQKEGVECTEPKDCDANNLTCNDAGRCEPLTDVDCGRLSCPPGYACQPGTECMTTCDESCMQQWLDNGEGQDVARRYCCQEDCSAATVECVQSCLVIGGYCPSYSFCDPTSGSCVRCQQDPCEISPADLCQLCEQQVCASPGFSDAECTLCRYLYCAFAETP